MRVTHFASLNADAVEGGAFHAFLRRLTALFPRETPLRAVQKFPSALACCRVVIGRMLSMTPEAFRKPLMRWRLACSWLMAVKVGLGALIVVELASLLAIAVWPVASELTLAPEPLAQPSQLGPSSSSIAVPSPSAGSNQSLFSALSRPLFQVEHRQRGPVRDESPGALSPLAAVARRLSLIGIVAGASPQAVLEDSETKKTYIVTQGQSLTEGILVDEVRNTSVVLEAHGERIELFL